eukprot:scaffold153799_cov29-Tisochrysis_lutea.AAC.6
MPLPTSLHFAIGSCTRHTRLELPATRHNARDSGRGESRREGLAAAIRQRASRRLQAPRGHPPKHRTIVSLWDEALLQPQARVAPNARHRIGRRGGEVVQQEGVAWMSTQRGLLAILARHWGSVAPSWPAVGSCRSSASGDRSCPRDNWLAQSSRNCETSLARAAAASPESRTIVLAVGPACSELAVLTIIGGRASAAPVNTIGRSGSAADRSTCDADLSQSEPTPGVLSESWLATT